MGKRLSIFLLFSFVLHSGLSPHFFLSAQEDSEKVDWSIISSTPQGYVEVDPETGVTRFGEGGILQYDDIILSADEGSFNEKTGEVVAAGNVILRRGGQVWYGDPLHYNVRTKEMKSDSFRAGMDVFYVKGDGMISNPDQQTYSLTNAFLTSDNLAEPKFRIQTSSLTVAPGKYVSGRNAVVYMDKVPVMYFPYWKQSLGTNQNAFRFKPGFRSSYGAFLETEYSWQSEEGLEGTFHTDLYSKKGVGFGPDLRMDFGEYGDVELKTYYLNDLDPGDDYRDKDINEDRHRFDFVYRGEISTNFTAKLVVRKQSDREVIRDFFESEYRENVEPNSFLEINRQWENSSLNLLSQARMNDFFETVERLPDLKYTSLRQQLGVSPIFYESESSAGYYRHKFVDDELPEFTAFRADTYHQLLVPKTFFNWLNVTPKAGGRFTHYGEAGGSGGLTNERDRWIFNTGVELSTKVWRVWKNTKSDFLQVDGLRHIFEPTLNYVFVPKPDARPGEIPQFDTVQPHLRLLPIDFPDFNSIDAIDGQNTLRFGIRNKFQTKRNGKIDNLIHWHLLMDWRLDPGIDNKNYSDVYSYLDFKPRDWLILTSEVRVDADDGRLNQSNHSIDYRPNETWSILLGHWFLDSNDGLLRRPYIADPGPFDPEGNNLIYTNFFYRFNEEWGINLRHYFEARDGTMEEQDYTLYRDLRSWTAGLTFRVRESRTDSTDFTVAVTFSFKAVPRYDVGDDVEQMPLLLGG